MKIPLLLRAINAQLDRVLETCNRFLQYGRKIPIPRWGWHVIFWSILGWSTWGAFHKFFAPTPTLTPNPLSVYLVWSDQILLSIGSFLLIGYVVLPVYFYKKKYVQAITAFFLYWLISAGQTKILFNLIADHLGPAPRYVAARVELFNAHSWVGFFTESNLFWFNYAHNFSYVLTALLIKGIRDTARKEKKTAALEQEKLQLELTFLRSQINPHFLFNAFNSLYAMILSKNAEATRILEDLSDVMRYTLYETKSEFVALESELHFLAHYLRLEAIRLNDNVTLSSSIKGQTGFYGIPPMILVCFLENAFKHGIHSSVKRGYLNLSIEIDAQHDTLRMDLRNSKDVNSIKRKEGGIGIVNVRRRLDLLYQNNYSIAIDDTAQAYSVCLTMPIRILPLTEIDNRFHKGEPLDFPFQTQPQPTLIPS